MLSDPRNIHIWNARDLSDLTVQEVVDMFKSNSSELRTYVPDGQVSNDTLWLLDKILQFVNTHGPMFLTSKTILSKEFYVVSRGQFSDWQLSEISEPIFYEEDIVPSTILKFDSDTLDTFIFYHLWCIKVLISEIEYKMNDYMDNHEKLVHKPSIMRQFTRGYKKLYDEGIEWDNLFNDTFDVAYITHNIHNYRPMDLNILDDDPNEPTISPETIEILILRMPFEEIHSIYPISSQYRHVLDRRDVLSALENRWQLRDVNDYEDLYDQYVMKYPVDFIIKDSHNQNVFYLDKQKYIRHAVIRNSPEYLNQIIEDDEFYLLFAIWDSLVYDRQNIISQCVRVLMDRPTLDESTDFDLYQLYHNKDQTIKHIMLRNGYVPPDFKVTEEENTDNLETILLAGLEDVVRKLSNQIVTNEIENTIFTQIAVTSLRRLADQLEKQ